jgi:hypothetical protein
MASGTNKRGIHVNNLLGLLHALTCPAYFAELLRLAALAALKSSVAQRHHEWRASKRKYAAHRRESAIKKVLLRMCRSAQRSRKLACF